jgi:hypothetical protein
MTESEAEASLAGVGLVKGEVTQATSDVVEAGDVMGQDPNSGVLVPYGSAVDLVISVGPGVGWVSPTGDNDPNSKWYSDADARDDNESTYAYTITQGEWLELTLSSPLLCDKIRILPYIDVYSSADVEVYYDESWHNIHSGGLTTDTWNEIAIGSSEMVTKARVRASVLTELWSFAVYEFDFHN